MNDDILDKTGMDDLQQVLVQCYQDTKVAGKVFFPDRFHRPFDPIHDQIFEKIENSDSQHIAIAAPRGIGKTSINNLLLPAKKILFRDAKYIVPVSASATSAEQQAENLKYELTQNDTITKLFGDVSTSNFSKEQWVVDILGEKICVMPRGAGQQIRGLLYRNYRPDLIIVDDLEDPEHIESEEQREKKKRWFYADLMNCIDRGSKDWKIIVLGTILHESSLLSDLLESARWDSVRLEMCDENFKSNAPSMMTDQEIQNLAEAYREDGQIDVFYREYRNLSISTEDAAFQQKYFKYYEPSEIDLDDHSKFETIIIIDPAKTAKFTSADSAIVAVTINLHSHALYVRDISRGKFQQDEFYDEIVRMVRGVRATAVGVEVTGLHEFVTYPIRNALISAGTPVEVIELHARGGGDEKGKVKRIRNLVPFYRKGMVYHNKSCTGVLEQQLLSFPRSKMWDVMDALGYIVEMLERGERYMLPLSASDDSMNYTKQEAEAEFRELTETEDVIPPDTFDWRIT